RQSLRAARADATAHAPPRPRTRHPRKGRFPLLPRGLFSYRNERTITAIQREKNGVFALADRGLSSPQQRPVETPADKCSSALYFPLLLRTGNPRSAHYA